MSHNDIQVHFIHCRFIHYVVNVVRYDVDTTRVVAHYTYAFNNERASHIGNNIMSRNRKSNVVANVVETSNVVDTSNDVAIVETSNVDDASSNVDDVTTRHNYSYVATLCREYNINPKSMRAYLRRHTTTNNHRWNEQRDDIKQHVLNFVARRNARTNA